MHLTYYYLESSLLNFKRFSKEKKRNIVGITSFIIQTHFPIILNNIILIILRSLNDQYSKEKKNKDTSIVIFNSSISSDLVVNCQLSREPMVFHPIKRSIRNFSLQREIFARNLVINFIQHVHTFRASRNLSIVHRILVKHQRISFTQINAHVIHTSAPRMHAYSYFQKAS